MDGAEDGAATRPRCSRRGGMETDGGRTGDRDAGEGGRTCTV